VRYDYLDFSTVNARRLDCEAEVRLNRRLAAEVYLGVIPLVLGAAGRLSLGGSGETVDWLVRMQRLPAERMLDHLLRKGSVKQAEISQLAQRLARFYAALPAEPLAPEAYRQSLAGRIEDNLRELDSPEFDLPREVPAGLARFQLSFLQRHAEWFDQRVQAGRIVEGHGDLRPEHVCLLAEPVVIDCLEFNREFRILDPADELGYLALECERLQAPQVARWLLDGYTEASGDTPPAALLHFYQSCRATLRAKLALWHLRDDGRHPPGKWVATARAYLELAQRHADSAAG
jgi:aminoglycoside phosphotransferase family enzyme